MTPLPFTEIQDSVPVEGNQLSEFANKNTWVGCKNSPTLREASSI